MIQKARFVSVLLAVLFLQAIGAETSDGAKKAIASAFSLSDRAKIIAALESSSAKQTAITDKKAILSTLASYEERTGSPDSAARHYAEAALADPASRDDSLLLDAARSSLASNDVSGADGYVRSVLLTCFDDKILVRARVYAAWIALSSDDSAAALALIRSLSRNAAFASYAPELLFTLWWADGDSASRETLTAQYPNSPEAAVARGEMALSPMPFWYLMGRNATEVASFAREGAKNLPKTAVSRSSGTAASVKNASSVGDAQSVPDSAPPVSGDWQQVGFFKNNEYADELVAKLTKAGFKPVVRREKRPSGTVYFAVLVSEDKNLTTASRLKDAGFESYLVTDGK